MKLKLKSAIVGVATLTIASSLAIGGSVANAATGTSPYDPPAVQTATNNSGATQGTLSFYDAAGNQITGGASNTPPAYIRADTDTGRPGDTLSTAFAATPVKGQPGQAWASEQISAADAYPRSSGPFSGQPQAVVGSTFVWMDPAGYPGNVPNANTDPEWTDLYQIRLLTSGPGQGADATRYASATISVNNTAGTWSQVFPVPPAPATAPGAPTGVSATGGQNTASVSFTAPASDGGAAITSYTATATFSDGTTSSVSNATSPITFSALAPGSYTFTVTATNSAGTSAASSPPAAATVTGPPAPAVALSVSGAPYGPYTFTANITPSTAAGSVAFFDNGSATALPGTVTSPSAGTYELADVALTAGSHSVVAKYTPTDPAAYSPSQSAPQAFLTQAQPQGACSDPASVCSEEQTIRVTVPVGTLVISTPYTPTAPLVLPTMQLDQGAQRYNSSATFADIRVTDTRAGDLPWTVQALSGDLSNGVTGVIDGRNVGLTGITSTPGSGFDGTVTPTDQPAADGVAPGAALAAGANDGLGGSLQTIASANNGAGTVTMQGLMSIIAPTTTLAGTYDGLVTFTVG